MKEKIDKLIINGYVLTMDNKGTIIKNGGVAVNGDKILDIDKTSKIEKRYNAEYVFNAKRMVIMPGLIDTYGHAGHGMVGGFHHPSHGWPARELYWMYSTPDWWYAEAKLAATERLRFGTTTGTSIIGATPARTDNPIFAYKNADAYSEVGIRGVFGVGPPDIFVPHINTPWTGGYLENGEWVKRGFTYDTALSNACKIIDKWHLGANGKVRIALNPAYIFGRPGSSTRYGYDYSDDDAKVVLEKAEEIRMYAELYGVQIHTHIFRGAIDFALDHYGRQKVDELLGPDVVIAHGNALTPSEIQTVGRNKSSVATAPSTGENIWYGYAPVLELLEAGANVTISTDGSAPRFSFDLWKDITRAMWNQYVKHSDMRVLPVGRTLRMVTIDAAKALGIDDQIGSLELGKKADIIMIDLDKPHLTPQTFIPNLLANYVNGYDVDTVMVDGEILMESTDIKSVEVSDVLENARREAEKSYQYIDLTKYTSAEEPFWHGLRWE